MVSTAAAAVATIDDTLLDSPGVKQIAKKIGTPEAWDVNIFDYVEQVDVVAETGPEEKGHVEAATEPGQKGHVEAATEPGETGHVEAATGPGEKGDVEAETGPLEEVHVESALMEESLLQDWREKWESDLIHETLALKSQLQVIEQPKDCKCLFHCWSHHLVSPGLNADALRTAACDEMALREEVVLPFFWIKVRV